SAPGIATPSSSIDVGESINAGCMILHSFPVDGQFEVLVEPDKSYEAVAAENRHQRQMTGLFEAPLEILVRSRRLGRARTSAGMAVKMCQQLVCELLELDQQPVS